MSTSARDHHDAAAAQNAPDSIRAAVLTISDTRTPDNDTSGNTIATMLDDAGFTLAARALVPDDPAAIESALTGWLAAAGVDVIITTGGTGIARRDNTIDVVRRRLSLELEGFGELFRMLSYAQIGSSAMLSRAIGGLAAGGDHGGSDTFIFALPGSTKAVELAMGKLIVPELPHLVWQRRPPPPR